MKYPFIAALEEKLFVQCPICGFDYVHFKEIKKLIADDNYYYTKQIILDEKKFNSTKIKEPSDFRGDCLSITFWCEDGHEFDVRIYFHKGNMFVRIFDVTPKKIAPPEKSKKEEYHEYLQSEKWKKKAARKRKQAGNKCQLCNRGDITLHVHHRTYENIYKEKLADLIVLCENCHKMYHDSNKGK